jgi:Leucine-rich repeat (LRR) protein
MKQIGIIILGTLCTVFSLYSQIVSIPDTVFLNILIEKGVDLNSDRQISLGEAEAVKQLHIYGEYNPDPTRDDSKIHSLQGIEAFVNLEYLTCTSHQISIIDLSGNTALKTLDIQMNGVDSINITNCLSLDLLWCGTNRLSRLDIPASMP